MKKLIKYIAIIALIIVLTIGTLFMISPARPIYFIDYSYKLTSQRDTLTLSYTRWACACANWLPQEELDRNRQEEYPYFEDLHIYIEANNSACKIPEKYIGVGYGNHIKVYGQYFKNLGISKDYSRPTNEFPDYARVFQYDSFEIIKPFIVYEFKGDSSYLLEIDY